MWIAGLDNEKGAAIEYFDPPFDRQPPLHTPLHDSSNHLAEPSPKKRNIIRIGNLKAASDTVAISVSKLGEYQAQAKSSV